jgi:hypothetical protein
MTIRTTESTVTFRHPFLLSAFDAPYPAGTYRLVVDEEQIPDVSFRAWHRMATMLHTPAIGTPGTSGEVFTITQEELEAALKADGGTPGEAAKS